jgi:hypothetical protein
MSPSPQFLQFFTVVVLALAVLFLGLAPAPLLARILEGAP